MGNRNVQGRTLLPHQRKIWTEAFKASLYHTSIESAERKAWQAVDICERVGAFGEALQQTDSNDSPVPLLAAYKEAWKCLAIRVSKCGKTDHDWETVLCKSMNNFALGKIGINDFQVDLEEIFPEECD